MITNNFQNITDQTTKIFKSASDEAVNLRITEKILSEVERRLLKTSPSLFDIDSIKTYLQKFKNLSTDFTIDDSYRIEFGIQQEFRLWRNLLEQRDEKIETYHLRRFFDTTSETLDVAVYIALTHFYRNIPSSPTNLSKFDLVVTRLFTKKSGTAKIEPRLNRREITKTLILLFNGWDGKINYSANFSPETINAVAQIDHFIVEAEALRDFEELIKSNLFERFRTFKREIGNLFYEPLVLATTTECNILIGNVFNYLLAKANDNLSVKLKSKLDLAGAFHDTSPNAQIHVSEILDEIRAEDNFSIQKSEDEETSHIWELLEMVSGKTSETKQTVPSNTGFEIIKSYLPVHERIADLLETLAAPKPDVKLLRDYMQNSKFLWMLDLNDFIGSESDELDKLCREVLSVILQIDVICYEELNYAKEISTDTTNEVANLLQRSQNLAEHLDNLLETAKDSIQFRLLIVSNKLLETRLKFERTIVRLGSRQLGLSKDSANENLPINEVPAKNTDDANVIKPKINSWLVAATFLVAFVSGILFLFAEQIGNNIPLAQDVEEINVVNLPDKEHIAVAFRQHDTLFVTSKDSWRKLPEVQKRQNLESLANQQSKIKISTVIVTDADGQPIGDISPTGVHFPEDITETN